MGVLLRQRIFSNLIAHRRSTRSRTNHHGAPSSLVSGVVWNGRRVGVPIGFLRVQQQSDEFDMTKSAPKSVQMAIRLAVSGSNRRASQIVLKALLPAIDLGPRLIKAFNASIAVQGCCMKSRSWALAGIAKEILNGNCLPHSRANTAWRPVSASNSALVVQRQHRG